MRAGRLLAGPGGLAAAGRLGVVAAFHAARALLATCGLDSRRHSGIIGMFQQHFVKTGIVPADVCAL
jgi:hypothetical protein